MKYAATLIILIFINPMSMNASLPDKDLLPESIGPWTIRADTVYTPEDLYDYINGGAELYISYGFSEVISRIYSARDQPDIVVDVFEMNSSSDAYGVFMFSAEEVQQFVGQGTQYNEGFMLFWMDHYFVSIMSYPESPESKDALIVLARTIESGIGSEGELPKILKYLPGNGLEEMSIRYFHHYAWLNSHYYIASENILLINDDTEAVLAKYGDPAQRSILLVIEYPDVEHAEKAARVFSSQYLPELAGKQFVKVEDGTYAGLHLQKNILVAVFNAKSGEDVENLIREVNNEVEKNNH